MDLYQWRNKGKDIVCYKKYVICLKLFSTCKKWRRLMPHKVPRFLWFPCEGRGKPVLSMCSASRETQFTPSIHWHMVSWFLQIFLVHVAGYLRTRWKNIDWGLKQLGGYFANSEIFSLKKVFNKLIQIKMQGINKQMKRLTSSIMRSPVLHSWNYSY